MPQPESVQSAIRWRCLGERARLTIVTRERKVSILHVISNKIATVSVAMNGRICSSRPPSPLGRFPRRSVLFLFPMTRHCFVYRAHAWEESTRYSTDDFFPCQRKSASSQLSNHHLRASDDAVAHHSHPRQRKWSNKQINDSRRATMPLFLIMIVHTQT